MMITCRIDHLTLWRFMTQYVSAGESSHIREARSSLRDRIASKWVIDFVNVRSHLVGEWNLTVNYLERSVVEDLRVSDDFTGPLSGYSAVNFRDGFD